LSRSSSTDSKVEPAAVAPLVSCAFAVAGQKEAEGTTFVLNVHKITAVKVATKGEPFNCNVDFAR
jgi:hypothetical protein